MLRLACKRGRGFQPERQTALTKAIEHATKYDISLVAVIYELQIDISDLSHSLNLFTKQTYTNSTGVNAPKSKKPRTKRDTAISGIYPVAGFQYYEGPTLKTQFRVGDPVRLIALTSNPHDSYAVAIYWKTYMIGYIPMRSNMSIWAALRAEQPLRATISSVDSHNSYGAVRIEIHK
ncbi:MAG: HIRAN domain-containing protein [Limisphaerales bacterium]